MTLPRRLLVNPTEPGWYHCVSRCVRRAFLCGDGQAHRKDWLVDRLKLLAGGFAVEIAAYAIMSNHIHLVVRLDPGSPHTWPAQQVAATWLRIFPSEHQPDGAAIAPTPARLAELAQDREWIATRRARLGDLGWFMRALKEPIARRANREDCCTGAFWEGRYRSIALLDEAAVVACMAYVDLNPVRATVAEDPESSNYTSIQDRIHARQYYRAAIGAGESAPERARRLFTRLDPVATPSHPEDGLWLWELAKPRQGRGFLPVDAYLTLVDATGRLIRSGQRGRIDPALAAVLERLAIDGDAWPTIMGSGRQMRGTGLGSVTARAVEAKRRGVGWVVNTCPLFERRHSAA